MAIGFSGNNNVLNGARAVQNQEAMRNSMSHTLGGAQAAQNAEATRNSMSQALSGAQAAQNAEAMKNALSQVLSGAQAAQNAEAARADQAGTTDHGMSAEAIDGCRDSGNDGRSQSLADALSSAFSDSPSTNKSESSTSKDCAGTASKSNDSRSNGASQNSSSKSSESGGKKKRRNVSEGGLASCRPALGAREPLLTPFFARKRSFCEWRQVQVGRVSLRWALRPFSQAESIRKSKKRNVVSFSVEDSWF